MAANFGITWTPAQEATELYNIFAQDEITLVEYRLKLTLGSKFENNDYTGFEFQPSGRIAWTNGRNVVWSAISRAVRTPSRIDAGLWRADVIGSLWPDYG